MVYTLSNLTRRTMTKYKYPMTCLGCPRILSDWRDHSRGRCSACYARERKQGTLQKLAVADPHVPLSDHQREVIEGHMLGDGGTYQYGNARHPYFAILRATRDREYLQWTVRQLENLVTSSGIYDKSVVNVNGNTIYSSRFITTRLSALQPLHDRWYPDRGRKQVPRDLVLTPLKIAIWLADDGCIFPVRKTRPSGAVVTKLSTDGFPESDTRFLARTLSSRYGENFRVHKNGTGFSIQVSSRGSLKLFEEIDSVWPEGIDRKAYWRLHDPKPDVRVAAAGHCINGHLRTLTNTTQHPRGTKICRTCQTESNRRSKMKRG